MRVAGLFSGIGGLELPFSEHGATTELLCDVWDPAQKVLEKRFPDIRIHGDISTLNALPSNTDIVTAGFPCTDLSQAGRTAGIKGNDSGLVSHVFRLLENRSVHWLVLENVRNMLVLDKGKAMSYLTRKLEELGFRWAYRLVDTRFSGIPQRRHRVLMVASRNGDPREVLFADDSTEQPASKISDDAFGFYWTEGLRGLGWGPDCVPPLKGGSAVGIPSPPAIWVPSNEPGLRIVKPSIEDAEALQGFDRGWTEPAHTGNQNGPRWKLVGNAVSVGVAEWLVGRLFNPARPVINAELMSAFDRWPNAAFGEKGSVWRYEASTWPIKKQYRHLSEVLTLSELEPLSVRATAGFLQRATRSTLRFDPRFLNDVREHIEFRIAA